MSTPRCTAFAAVILLAVAANAPAAPFTFDVDPAQSGVDLTLAFVNTVAEPDLVGSSDTRRFGLAGSIVLDVEVVGDAVASVDFVSGSLRYTGEAVFDDLVFSATALNDSEVDLLLPGDLATIVGGFTEIVPPTLTPDPAGATESGSGGEIDLTGASFGFVGTGQVLETSGGLFPEGFGYELGPYRGDDDAFDGLVTLVGDTLTLDATFFSSGVGGAGGLASSQSHDGSLVATAVVPEPASAALVAVSAGLLLVRRRR